MKRVQKKYSNARGRGREKEKKTVVGR